MAADPLPGGATPEGCRRLARRRREEEPALVASAYRRLGRTGLTVAKIGFGGYRVAAGHEAHRRALAAALAEGCNLLDTAANYGAGASERLFGQVLAEAVARGTVARDEVVVATKGGYLQGQAYAAARARAEAGEARLVEVDKGVGHTLDPALLEAELTASLARLGLARVDLYLLHNPEVAVEARRGTAPAERLAAELAEATAEAFAWCERQAAAGRIGWYGVSSNALASPRDDPERLDLVRLWEQAEAAAAAVHGGGAAPRFAVVQLPYNLLEPEAATRANTEIAGARCTVLEAARRLDLGVVTNRPLNALAPSGGLVRLASPETEEEAAEAELAVERELAAVAAAEQEIDALLEANGASERFAGGHLLSLPEALPPALAQLHGSDQWEHVAATVILPNVRKMGRFLHRELKGATGWQEALDRYLQAVDRLLPAVGRLVAARSRARNEALRERLAAAVGVRGEGMSLSQIALAFCTATPGVAATLCGMRRTAYVTDALALLAEEELPDPLALAACARG